VFAVNTHPLKAFSTKKRNTLEQGDMFMVKAKNPLAALASYDRLRKTLTRGPTIEQDGAVLP
jgi:hypothetical protein